MSSGIRHWIRWAVVIAAVVAVPIGLAAAQADSNRPSGLSVWIDRPLDGTVVGAGPVLVTAHLAHPNGVTSAELRVAGRPVLEPVSLSGSPFEMIEFEWTPTESGVIPLAVAGEVGGAWGQSATVEIVVDLGEGPVPTSSSSTTVAPSATSTTIAQPASVTTVSAVTESSTPSPPTTRPSETTTSSSATPSPTTVAPTTAAPTTVAPTTAAPTTVAPTTAAPTTVAPTTAPCVNGQPQVTGPANNARTYNVTWTYSGCPTGGFSVLVSEDAGFTDIIVQASAGPSARSWGPVPVDPCQQYHVRVSASFEAGDVASSVYNFTSTGC